MKTSIPCSKNSLKATKSVLSTVALAFALAMGTQEIHAQVAANFTIVNHATGRPLSLTNYQGSVVVLDFWAYWCEYCQAAALDLEPNITKFYRNAGGNSNGVPVQVISVNIDCSDLTLENSYITTYGLELVGDDCDEIAFSQFDFGGIPQFAVINGTTNSLNYLPWQIVSEPTGYLTNYTVPLLQSLVDSVQTPAPVSTVTHPVNGSVVAPSNLSIEARIVTNGKIIKKVEFFNGTTLLGFSTNSPYSLVWSNVPIGAKSVFARAHYGTSSAADSAAVNFTVAVPVTNQLQIRTLGLGTISPNYSNAWLTNGQNYSITSAPASGFVFTQWTISTNWIGQATVTATNLQFIMQSNLTLQAAFNETSRPTLTITAPTAGQHLTNALATISGTNTDNWGVSAVWYQLNSNAWNRMALSPTNSTNWTTPVELVSGTNTVRAYALNLGGNVSITNSVSFVSSNTFKLQLALTNPVPLNTNGLTFSLQLSTGLNGHIQVSTNLTNWATLTNFVGTNTAITFQDPAATNSSSRYYRAVIP